MKRLADALAAIGEHHLEEVTDKATPDKDSAQFEDRELLEQSQEVQKLLDKDKALVKSFLSAFLF